MDQQPECFPFPVRIRVHSWKIDASGIHLRCAPIVVKIPNSLPRLPPQLRKRPATLQQLFRFPLLQHHPIPHHHNPICVP